MEVGTIWEDSGVVEGSEASDVEDDVALPLPFEGTLLVMRVLLIIPDEVRAVEALVSRGSSTPTSLEIDVVDMAVLRWSF